MALDTRRISSSKSIRRSLTAPCGVRQRVAALGESCTERRSEFSSARRRRYGMTLSTGPYGTYLGWYENEHSKRDRTCTQSTRWRRASSSRSRTSRAAAQRTPCHLHRISTQSGVPRTLRSDVAGGHEADCVAHRVLIVGGYHDVHVLTLARALRLCSPAAPPPPPRHSA